MKISVFSVFDNKLQAFLQPFFSPNRATAIRNVVYSMQDSSSNFRSFPADFGLFYIGEFDDSNGVLSSSVPENLGLLSQYLEK
jgi:hypothetical protein